MKTMHTAAALEANNRDKARCRARRKAGLLVLQIECSEALIEKLIDAQLLPEAMADDREAIARATEKLLKIFAEKNPC